MSGAGVFQSADTAVIAAGGAAVHTIGRLTNGNEYEVQVAALSTFSGGNYSRAVRGTPARTPPGAPRDVRIRAGNGRLAVAWRAPADDGGENITAYRVRWKTTTAAAYAHAGAANAAAYTISGLANGMTFVVQVAAVNAIGAGEYSISARGMPAATAPGRPRDVTVGNRDRRLKVAWRAPADDGGENISAYRLRWKTTTAAAYARADAADVRAAAHTIANLANGAAVEVQVAAVNAIGAGEYSDAVRGTPTTTITKPGRPRDVTLSAGNHRIALTWVAPADDGAADIAVYSVRWKLAQAVTFASADTAPAALGHTIENLVNGSTYDVQVAAANAAGSGEFSAAMQGIPASTSLDVDADGDVDSRDGILIARYLLGVRGASLMAGQSNGNADTVAANIAAGVTSLTLDVDGNKTADDKDGILIARYLLGLRGEALRDGLTTMPAGQVEAGIAALMPPAQ